ncbi:MAG: acyl-CoA dehydrogenase family protein [Nannocystaceae bacterium]
MTKNLSDLLADVDRVARDTIAAGAARIDAEGEFPRAAIDALAQVGALGVLSSPDVGGLGLGLGAAARVSSASRRPAVRPRWCSPCTCAAPQ